MSSVFGNNIKISVFGQSHSPAIGVVLDGIPAGLELDADELCRFMARRAPGGIGTTERIEPDIPEIVSGLVGSTTCGAPICVMIRNRNANPSDYNIIKNIPRPSHADYSEFMRDGEYRDYRGGGHLSGRLTAALCAAGGIAAQLLGRDEICAHAHILELGGIRDKSYPFNSALPNLNPPALPVTDIQVSEKMKSVISEVAGRGDTVGGIIECMLTGLPAGLGSPVFDGIENRIAAAVFAVPSVKGIEFGAGFGSVSMTGRSYNDEFKSENGVISTATNNDGGIQGGITNGMPVLFRVVLKPVPSIKTEQRSFSLADGAPESLTIHGRHDACVLPRAVVCIEAAALIAAADITVR